MLLLEAPTLRQIPQPLPPLGVSPLLPPLPLVTTLTHKTYHIRILRPLKRLPFRSLKVDPVGTIEEGYKYFFFFFLIRCIILRTILRMQP